MGSASQETSVALGEPCQVDRRADDPHYLDVIQLPVHAGDDGLSLDLASAGLMIVSIGEGAVRRHNATSKWVSYQVRVHDVVVAVDGETDPVAMLERLASQQTYVMDIVHPIVSRVRISRPTKHLGLRLRYTRGSTLIEVAGVDEGGDVDRYNAEAEPYQQVHEGSLISSVSGVTGSVQAMMMKLKSQRKQVDLTLFRVVSDMHTSSVTRASI